MKVFFIVNEFAGNGRGRVIWSRLQKKLDFTYTVHKTEYPKHAIKIVSDISCNYREQCLVIGIGGDGTLNEITTGAAVHSNIVVSAVKAGSGNDFARGYQVFSSAKALNRYVNNDELRSKDMNIGVVHSKQAEASFVNNIGFGFDALVATSVNQSKIKRLLNKIGLGGLAYVLLTIKLLFSFKRFTVAATIDDKAYSFSDVWFVALCNQPYFGGGMKISPHSKMDDSMIEFVVVQNLSSLKLLLLFLSVFTGKHEKLKEITFIKAQQVKLMFDRSVVSHVDGDLFDILDKASSVSIELSHTNWKLAQ